MITNLRIGNFGRLGNQFFQYAILRAISIKNGFEIVLPSNDHTEFHGQPFLLKKFNIKCTYSDNIKPKNFINEKVPNVFESDYIKVNDNTSIEGYFQNLQYFDSIKKNLKEEFLPSKSYLKEADNFLEIIKEKYPNKKIASFHIRRGDQFKFRVTDLTRGNPGIKIYGSPFWFSKRSLFYKYFKKVLKEIDLENTVFLVFSGGSRNSNYKNLRWINKCFKNLNFEISMNSDPIIDFSIMLKTDINILSYGSSFGWWAAYLNENNQKYAPENYFFGTEGGNMDFLFNNEFQLL